MLHYFHKYLTDLQKHVLVTAHFTPFNAGLFQFLFCLVGIRHQKISAMEPETEAKNWLLFDVYVTELRRTMKDGVMCHVLLMVKATDHWTYQFMQIRKFSDIRVKALLLLFYSSEVIDFQYYY